MNPVKKDGEIRVTLLRFGQPDANGRIFSFEQLQPLIDGNFLKRVSDKTLFGEVAPPKEDLGVVRITEVAEEEVCLRVTSVNLQRHALLGRVVPAGPKKAEFEALISQYVQPIPLAMRAYQHADGSLSITSFDLCSSMLQNHPKIGEGVTLSSSQGFLPVKTSDFLEQQNAGGTLEQNTLLNPQPIKKPYVKPEVKTVTQAEYDAAVKPTKRVRKKAAKKTARGMTATVLHLDESPFVPMNDNDIAMAHYKAAFKTYEEAFLDDDFRRVIGANVYLILTETRHSINFTAVDGRLYEIYRTKHDNELYAIMTVDTGFGTERLTGTTLPEAFQALNEAVQKAGDDFTNRNKETTPVSTPIPTVATDKKPSAKAVFKNIEPIVSKNVEAHYDQVFRVNPKGKLDGTFKKLGEKKGAFVRLPGSPDIYMLPYTIKSDKPAAGERSLQSALATRNVEVLSVDDLNPAPATDSVQFKFVEKKK